MRLLKPVAALFSVLLISAFCGALPSDFSADIVNVTPAGTFTGKMYISKDKTRMELPQSIVITRIDRKTVYMVIPGANMYMEQPIDASSMAQMAENIPEAKVRKTKIGEEKVNGIMCDRYLVVYEYEGNMSRVIQWIDKSSGMMIKVGSEDDSWYMEYKNIKVGPQDASLFEVPPGCRKILIGIPMDDIDLSGMQ